MRNALLIPMMNRTAKNPNPRAGNCMTYTSTPLNRLVVIITGTLPNLSDIYPPTGPAQRPEKNTMESIEADAIARYFRMMGHPTWFLTGTDEHGLKQQRTAEKFKVTPRELCDENAEKYRENGSPASGQDTDDLHPGQFSIGNRYNIAESGYQPGKLFSPQA